MRGLVRAGVFVIAIAPLWGCRTHARSATEFRWNIASGLNSLDPALMNSVAAGQVGIQMYDGLVRLDSAGTIQPALARSWEFADSGRTITFHLRSSVRFHDDPCFAGGTGRVLTANDVKYSFERICDPHTKSTGWWVFHDRVTGADTYHDAVDGDKRVAGVEGFEAQNDSTFVVRLVAPFAPFLAMLTMPYGFVVAHEASEKYGADAFLHPVGTGPFRVARWAPNEELELVRSGEYWEARHGTIETVRVTFARDVKTEFLEFTRGTYDLALSVPQGFENSVFDSTGAVTGDYARFTAVSMPSMTTEYYGILLDTTCAAACATPLASNVLLRQALNCAVDRDAIVRYVLRGQAISAHGVLPPGVARTGERELGYRYDPEKAKALLAQAGFPDGKGLPPLTLQTGANETSASVAEAVQQQWAGIGVQVSLRQVDFPQHLDMIRSGKLALWRTQWVADYCDPENFLSLFATGHFSPGGPNTTHFSNPEYDALYSRITDGSSSDGERTEWCAEMDSIVVSSAPWIFLYYPKTIRLLQPDVVTFTSDPLGRFSVADIVKR